MKATVAQKEKVLDLGGGLSIWKAHLDALREQDVNPRVMQPDRFRRLVANVQKEKHLESLPLCHLTQNEAGTEELAIISGHHRTRAARAAGIKEVFVLAYERELSKDEVIAKQLAHNALAGEDDTALLAQLWRSISDIDARIESGITEGEIVAAEQLESVRIDEVAIDLEFEMLAMLFLPRNMERLDEALSLLQKDTEHVLIAAYEDWDKFKIAIKELSRREDVRNVGAMVSRMADITLEHYGISAEEPPSMLDEWIGWRKLFGTEAVPPEAAEVIKDALAKAQKEGHVGAKNRWQLVEYLAADYLAGE